MGDRRGDGGQARQDAWTARNWRLVVNVHVAEDDERALREVHAGERLETVTYFEDTLGRPPGRSDDPLREGVKTGTTLVGSPDTVAKGIERLIGLQPWRLRRRCCSAPMNGPTASRRWRSYELFARYVMPRFQGSLDTVRASQDWARANRRDVFGPNVAAIRRAYVDAGRPVPAQYTDRASGARDVVGKAGD